MHLGRALLGLPASLVLSLAVLAQADEQWQQPRQQHKPIAVRKMMDEGEKFFPEQYFAFKEADDHSSSSSSSKSLGQLGSFSERRYRAPVQLRPPTNGSSPMPPPFLVPFAVHEEDYDYETELEMESAHADSALSPRAALARLQGRDWSCPTGTASCSAIGYPYSCCASGETCYEIENVGLGPVGCCPTGESCSGSVTTCGAGTTACSEADGGGCCIAGFVCAGIGCVVTAATITTTSTVAATPSVVIVTVVVTQTASAGGITTLTSSLTSTVTPTSTTVVITTTATGGVAPVKPTSMPDSSTSTSTSTTTTTTSPDSTASYCPVGYYACLAFAGGGCCQTGRDCHTTSCPPASSSSTVVNVNGITIAVPADSTAAAAAAAATSAATCATGWFLCSSDSTPAAGAAAGCCPSGYACGTASCTLAVASSTVTATVQKELPSTASAASSRPAASKLLWLAAVVAVLAGSHLS